MQEELRTNRQILSDLASRYLEGLAGVFARLVYLANLRNEAGRNYQHPELSLIYRPEGLDQTLSKCHQELFESFLELSLIEQQKELLRYLDSSGQAIPHDPAGRRALFLKWMPPSSPEYLKELFLANLEALSETLAGRKSKVRSDS
jgi:hypothetical protein